MKEEIYQINLTKVECQLLRYIVQAEIDSFHEVQEPLPRILANYVYDLSIIKNRLLKC